MAYDNSRSYIIGKEYKRRATKKQKEYSNFKRQRDIMDYIDFYNGDLRDWNKLDKLKVNYDLLNGRLDVSLYDDPTCFEINGEMITFDYQSVSHYPLISQISNAIIGEQRNRPFKPSVKDNTPDRKTYYEKELDTKIQGFIQSQLQQQRQRITLQMMQGAGITDLYSLTPDQQMEFGQQVEQQLIKETPEDILDYMQYDFQTPTVKQAQAMLDYLVEYHNIEWQNVMGFKHAVVSGESYYFMGERNGELVFETVNPAYFDWAGSLKTEWSQHGTWAKREDWLTYQDVTQKHAIHLSERDLKDLDFYHEPIGGTKDWNNFDTEFHRKVQTDYANSPWLQEKYKDVNIKTKEGQRRMLDLYSDVYGNDPIFGNRDNTILGLNSFGVREAHIVWRDKRCLKMVKRLVDGRLRTFYLDEHYTPVAKDLEVEKIWVDEIWEGYKLGTWEAKYVNVRPVPYQYNSLDNPFNVDLPYYGKKFNIHNNVTRNSSLIDLGKTFQKDFDITMASLKQDMATNYGKKFLMLLSYKPDTMTFQQWMDSIRNSPFILADVHKKGLHNLDASLMRDVDMSRMADIAAKVQLLQFQRDGLARSMYFNEARQGAVGQYATSVNTEVNQVASYNQTALFFEQHRLIMEKSLQAFLNYARFYYKDNIEKAALFLDDVSLAELQVGPYTSYRALGISLNNSPEETQKISILKQQALTLIQNGSAPESVIQLIFADTEAEVRDIVRKETMKIEKRRQEEMAVQQQQFQATLKQKEESEQREAQLKYQMHTDMLTSQENRALIDSEKFAKANDVNRDNQNDLIEKTLLEINAKLQMHGEDIRIEEEKIRLQEKLTAAKENTN